MIAVGLILMMPFLFIGANLALILGAILSLVIGFFAGFFICFQLLDDCCCVAIILLPLAVVISSIVGFVWSTFFYILPVINQYIDRYIRTIGSLCRNNWNQILLLKSWYFVEIFHSFLFLIFKIVHTFSKW